MSMRSSTFRSTVAILWSVCNESRPIYCQADLNVLPVTKFRQKCQLCHIILYVSLWINLSFFHRLVVHFVCNDESYSCEIITTERVLLSGTRWATSLICVTSLAMSCGVVRSSACTICWPVIRNLMMPSGALSKVCQFSLVTCSNRVSVDDFCAVLYIQF